jgi:hypothetical protein
MEEFFPENANNGGQKHFSNEAPVDQDNVVMQSIF